MPSFGQALFFWASPEAFFAPPPPEADGFLASEELEDDDESDAVEALSPAPSPFDVPAASAPDDSLWLSEPSLPEPPDRFEDA